MSACSVSLEDLMSYSKIFNESSAIYLLFKLIKIVQYFD